MLMHWLSFKEKISTTTLREVMLAVAGALGADLSKVEANMRYYHWQYPEAKKMLIVLDTTNTGSDRFKYSIPAALSLYEVSAAHYGNVGSSSWGEHYSHTKIDGDIVLSGGQGSYTLVDFVPSKYRSREVAHEVRLEHKGGWTGVALFFLYG